MIFSQEEWVLPSILADFANDAALNGGGAVPAFGNHYVFNTDGEVGWTDFFIDSDGTYTFYLLYSPDDPYVVEFYLDGALRYQTTTYDSDVGGPAPDYHDNWFESLGDYELMRGRHNFSIIDRTGGFEFVGLVLVKNSSIITTPQSFA